MVAVPAATAVTFPFSSTVATPVLLLLQVTVLLVASSGVTVALRVSLLPTAKKRSVLFRLIPVTVTGAAVTVTVQLAVLLPFTVVTVMVAVPTDSGVTTPLFTVATDSSFDDQLTS